MSPEERRLLTDLFDRVRNASSTQRDRDAEDLIAQKLREQPYAAYYLAQAVIIQDQALQATTQRLQELEDEVHRLEADAGSSRGNQSGGFLGSLGSIFGGNQPSSQPSRSTYTQRQGQLYDDYARTGRYQDPEPEPAPSPWGRDGSPSPWAQPTNMSSSGGFLRGALTTAAGVAGGVLAADAIRDMFSSHVGGTNAFSNSLFGDNNNRPDETIVNNFFGDDNKDDRADQRSGGSSDSDSGSGWAGNDRDDDDNTDTADDSDFGDDSGGGDDSSFA